MARWQESLGESGLAAGHERSKGVIETFSHAAFMEGDPTGETGPTPMFLAQIGYGGENFWDATKWPDFFVLPMLDWILENPPDSWSKTRKHNFKKLVDIDPVAAWQAELDTIRVAYRLWSGEEIA